MEGPRLGQVVRATQLKKPHRLALLPFEGVQINAFPKMKQPRLINPMARMPHVNPIEEWKR
jgi:hypothetical protein